MNIFKTNLLLLKTNKKTIFYSETNCSVATNFTAQIFYHKNEHEIQTILQSLGQGFYRTHFAV